MSAALPMALRVRFQEYVEEGLSGRAAAARLKLSAATERLCALVGHPAPFDADPTGEWFTFDKGALKTGGGDGWADVWINTASHENTKSQSKTSPSKTGPLQTTLVVDRNRTARFRY